MFDIAWELAQETGWALLISALATYLLFAIYGHFRPVQMVVLPGEDETRDGLKIIKWYFGVILERLKIRGMSDDDKAKLDIADATLWFIALLFVAVCLRGAARIIAAAIVFFAIFNGIAPLM